MLEQVMAAVGEYCRGDNKMIRMKLCQNLAMLHEDKRRIVGI